MTITTRSQFDPCLQFSLYLRHCVHSESRPLIKFGFNLKKWLTFPFWNKIQLRFSDLIRTALPKSFSPTKVVLLIAELMLAVKSDVMLVTKDWSWRVFRRITGLHEVSWGSKEVLPSHSWVSQSVGNNSPISSSKLGVLSPKNIGVNYKLFS